MNVDKDDAAFRELLRERLERVDAKLTAVTMEIGELRERERDLAAQRGHLAALIGPDAVPAVVPSGVTSARSVGNGGEESSTADLVVRLLEELGRPLHYREIESQLRQRGWAVAGGKDPANTLLARYFRDARLYRPKRGVYDLRSNDPDARSIGSRKRS